jgi:hypothetical protein
VLGRYFTTPEGRFVGSYIDEIGNAALDQRATVFGDDDARRMAQDFNRVDLVNAFMEVGRSEAAARALGAVMTGWTGVRTAGFLDDANLQRGEVESAMLPSALVLDTIRQGFEAIGVPEASRRAWADTVKDTGSTYAALAGPLANLLGGAAKAGAAFGMGLSGSVAWAGSTFLANRETATDPPPVRGDDFSRALAETLRADMAATLAARRGESPPTGRDLATALSTAFPDAGDPFTTLMTLSAIEGYTNQHPGTHWSTR